MLQAEEVRAREQESKMALAEAEAVLAQELRQRSSERKRRLQARETLLRLGMSMILSSRPQAHAYDPNESQFLFFEIDFRFASILVFLKCVRKDCGAEPRSRRAGRATGRASEPVVYKPNSQTNRGGPRRGFHPSRNSNGTAGDNGTSGEP